MNPETSLINGEAPFFIECGNFKDALSTIFGDSENAKGNVGCGAEQVILVRNDSAKEEIFKYVGNKALVLTILECKGLEFRVNDILFIIHKFVCLCIFMISFEKKGLRLYLKDQ